MASKKAGIKQMLHSYLWKLNIQFYNANVLTFVRLVGHVIKIFYDDIYFTSLTVLAFETIVIFSQDRFQPEREKVNILCSSQEVIKKQWKYILQ